MDVESSSKSISRVPTYLGNRQTSLEIRNALWALNQKGAKNICKFGRTAKGKFDSNHKQVQNCYQGNTKKAGKLLTKNLLNYCIF